MFFLNKALANNDWHIRIRIAEYLKKVKPKTRKAIPILLKTLADPNYYVVEEAEKAAKKILSHRLVFCCLEALISKNSKLHCGAKRAIELAIFTLDIKLTQPQLKYIYHKIIPYFVMGMAASEPLIQKKSEKNLLWLLDLCIDDNPSQNFSNKIIFYLIYILYSQNRERQYLAAEILGKIGGTAKLAVTALRYKLCKSDRRLRVIMVDTLERINPPEEELKLHYICNNVIPKFIQALDDPDWIIRYVAIKVIGEIAERPELTIPMLRKKLKDRHVEVRKAVVEALRKYKE